MDGSLMDGIFKCPHAYQDREWLIEMYISSHAETDLEIPKADDMQDG